MAWRVRWHLECDHCGKSATFAGQPSTAVERKARRYKWAFVLDRWGLVRHLCPACDKGAGTRAMYEGKERTP